jgi:hypothetical protein
MGPHNKIKMVQIRKTTGKELTNFWTDRWGATAGEAPMVSRVKTATSFASSTTQGYDIVDSASYLDNNLLIHSIKCTQTQAGEDASADATDHAIMEIFDNPYESTLATAYYTPQTSLVLTDASTFNSTGRGTVNGVAFSWTAKNSNTLTVPDIGANFGLKSKVINMGSLGPGSGSASLKLKFMINAQQRMNSEVTLVFPIPMLLVNGGRVRRTPVSENGPVMNICYTVLESMGEIDPHKDIFLQSYYTAGTADDAVVTDSDVEVYGAYVNSTGTTEASDSYNGIKIKNGANSIRAQVHINETYSASYGDVEMGGTNSFPMWFPYPVYLKDGFTQAATGSASGMVHGHLTSFYRKVNAKGIDHGWT